MSPDVALAICRFVFDSTILSLWGASAYLWIVADAGLKQRLWQQMRGLRDSALLLVVAATFALLPLRTAMLGEGWSDALDIGMLHSVLFDTNIGLAWLIQVVAACLLMAVMLLARQWIAGTAIMSAVLLASLVITGHAAMHDGVTGLLHQANSVLHLLAAGAWVGALIPVVWLLPRLRDKDAAIVATPALIRFSTAGHLAVLLVVATGIINTGFILGKLPLDWTYDYQRLLTFKIALVIVMIVLAIINRYVFVPRLRQRQGMAQALVTGTIAEIVLSLAVIMLVAMFGMMQPY